MNYELLTGTGEQGVGNREQGVGIKVVFFRSLILTRCVHVNSLSKSNFSSTEKTFAACVPTFVLIFIVIR
jgi:hypothetical protein